MPAKNTEVRVAAIGDIHVREGTSGIRELFTDIARNADILALCGDLTNRGLPREAETLVDALSDCKIPVVAVLGNHDVECEHEEEIVSILCRSGIKMLDSEPQEIGGVGFAGVCGFCGGFDRHALAPFGERMVKGFVRQSMDEALRLESGLARLRTEHKVAVLHYAPVRDTVMGEPPEIFPFLGSSRLADPLDHYGVSAAVHGHAHRGAHEGKTAGGVPVYNVAHAVMLERNSEQPYLVLHL